MKNKIRLISIFVIIIIISIFISITQLFRPNVKSQLSQNNIFSAERAIKHLNIICTKPHPFGSDENIKVRDYIIDQISILGLKYKNYEDNILCYLDGSVSNGKPIMFVCHYDSVRTGPGAGDDGYAVTAFLESIRTIKNKIKLKNNVLFLFTNAEENGMVGAKKFAESQKGILKNIQMVFNFEARGNKGTLTMFQTSNGNYYIAKELFGNVTNFIACSFTQDIYTKMPNNTDFSIFNNLGIPGFNFSIIEGCDAYHTRMDNLKNADKKTIQQYGEVVMSLLMYYGNKSDFVYPDTKDDAVYFPLFKGFYIVYNQNIIWWINIFIFLFFIALFIISIILNKIKIGDFVKTFLIFLLNNIVLVVVSSLIIFLIVITNQKHIFQILMMMGYNFLYLLLFIFLFLLIDLLFYFVYYKKINFNIFFMPILFMNIIVMIPICMFLKGMSFMFTFPILFYEIIFLILILKKSEPNILTFILITSPFLIISPSLVYLMFNSTALAIIPIILLLSGLFLTLPIIKFMSILNKN